MSSTSGPMTATLHLAEHWWRWLWQLDFVDAERRRQTLTTSMTEARHRYARRHAIETW